MKNYYKQVCVKVTTDTQYDSIKPVLKEFLKNGTTFDVYVPSSKENHRNVNKMFDKTRDILRNDGFDTIKRSLKSNMQYHLALIAPHYEESINAKYYIKYGYGSCSSVKPSLTHHAHRLNRYHGYFMYNKVDAGAFNAITKTYLLPNLKYVGYEAKFDRRTKKQTILFLPSWDNQNNLEWIVSASKRLKEKYHIIVKLHPYGDFGVNITASVNTVKLQIKKNADEFYNGEASLSELLSRSDLVVSDLSGAIFESLYVRVPVVVYSQDVHQFDAEKIKSAVVMYADRGYIAVSKSVDELIDDVSIAFSEKYRKKQQGLSAEIFRQDFTDRATNSWMKIIKKYLDDDVNQDYIALHDLLTKEFWHYKDETGRLERELQSRNKEIAGLYSEIQSFLSVKRTIRLLGGNIKRRLTKGV